MTVRLPHLLGCALCAGLAAADAARAAVVPTALAAALLLALAAASEDARLAVAAAALALALGGWAWGSVRLAALDRSVLAPRIGTAERAVVDVLEPPRRATFELRARALVLRFGPLRPHEPVLLELPLGRAPPQGARLALLGQLRAPRGSSNGFDERTWLRRHGVHAVLQADTWRVVGRRGGLAGVGDRLHAWLARDAVPGLAGERRAVLEGVVLGEDEGLSAGLRQDFRASGLYHLLAVSGGNVAVVALGTLWLAYLVGVSRLAAEAGALAAIGGYVLAVGAQPSVVRAGVAGALGSLAWLAGRQRDAGYALVLGAVALLAWNPYTLLDPGFQLSFAAVLAIFFLAPRIARALEGYPLSRGLRETVAISAACGLATAPISWFQFQQVPLVTVPANAAAAPAVAPMLALALVCALVAPVAPPLATGIAWANGWLAAYLAACARLFGGLPGAQIRSPVAAAGLALCLLGAGAYAWRRGRSRAEAGLPPHRRRHAEDRARAAPAAGADR
ncbi:MAG: ComEC/Rec2 family competence protein [Thermoleophilia bacterium]|nr:ComEC/Rec2 family competence protein [Thermoleophilia bacterium]